MLDILKELFDTSGFAPRWYCGVWSARLGWLHVVSDILVFAAYMAIPCLLVYFIRRRRDVPFTPIFWLFGAFIAACGTTHLIEATIFWWPAYKLSGVAKLFTATVSWLTVVALIPVLPRALALPGLAKVNDDLWREVAARRAAEAEVKTLNAELEQRVAERTRQLSTANEELEGFTHTVAHDLRAPLRHLHGYAMLLLENVGERFDADAAHYADRISAAALRMGELVDDLLAFSRTGQAPPNMGWVELDRMVAEVREELSPLQQGRVIDWQVQALPAVAADAVLLRTVWVNLLSNALKFTARQPRTQIEIGAREENGEIIFHVRDNGVGFDMLHAEKLFGVFQRLHRREDFDGTGIGLATVRRIVERHGGRVWGEGAVNQGATIYFTVPNRPREAGDGQ